MVLTLLPSAPAALIAWAKNQTDLAAIHGGRVGTKLNTTLPAIRVQRIGGSADDDATIDEPLMQVELWAADDVTAEQFARNFVAALPGFRHTNIAGGGKLHTWTIESGPYFATDDPALSANVRYVLTLRLLTTS